MAYAPISLITIQYQNPNDNTPYSGAVLKAYAAGTSTNIPMATDVTGGTTFTSVALNSSGNPEHLGATIIPHVDQLYKIALYATQVAADADTPAVWTVDNLTPVTVTGSFSLTNAVSGDVSEVVSIAHLTTGTPTTGIGAALSLSAETGIGNIEKGLILEAVTTDITAGSEDFDFVVKLMAAGAAASEVLRVTSAGVATAGGTTLAKTSSPLSQFAATTSAQLAGVLSDETGSGAAVFATSPTLVTPALGTPSSGTLTNTSGLPAAGVVGTAAILGANTFTSLQTFKAGADIASATAIDLTAATGNTVVITGTATTTSLTMTAGQEMLLLPSGAWPMTFDATTMNINGGVSYTCAAGDRVFAVKDLAGVIRVSVTKQDGTSVVAGAGGMTLLSTVTASSSATVDIETTFDSTYDTYMITVSGIRPQNNSVQLNVRMKIAGAYDTASNYRYHTTLLGTNSGSYSADTANPTTFFRLQNIGGNAAGYNGNYVMYVHLPSNTSLRKAVHYEGMWVNSSGTGIFTAGGATNDLTAALTGIRFYYSSGNIASGEFKLYGLKKD